MITRTSTRIVGVGAFYVVVITLIVILIIVSTIGRLRSSPCVLICFFTFLPLRIIVVVV